MDDSFKFGSYRPAQLPGPVASVDEPGFELRAPHSSLSLCAALSGLEKSELPALCWQDHWEVWGCGLLGPASSRAGDEAAPQPQGGTGKGSGTGLVSWGSRPLGFEGVSRFSLWVWESVGQRSLW